MFVKVIIYENENGLETQRIKKQSLLIFFAAVLGSIFGLMGTFSALMALTEELAVKCLKKISMKNYKEEFERKVKKINYELENMGRPSNHKKIMPLNTTCL